MSKNVAVAGPGGLGWSPLKNIAFSQGHSLKNSQHSLTDSVFVGKHVIDALLESKEFNVTVLSRSAKPELEAKGATVKVHSHSSLFSL